MSKLAVLVQLLKLGNEQLAGIVFDDQVATAVRELALELMAADTPLAIHKASMRMGQAVVARLDSLEEAPLKALPWSRSPMDPSWGD